MGVSVEATEGGGLCRAEFDEDMARTNKPHWERNCRLKKKVEQRGFPHENHLKTRLLLLQLVLYDGAGTR